jgi:hypothetical protein
MPESPADPDMRDAGDDTHVRPAGGSAGGPSRWLTVLLIVLGALVVLGFVLLHLTGAVGPGAH